LSAIAFRTLFLKAAIAHPFTQNAIAELKCFKDSLLPKNTDKQKQQLCYSFPEISLDKKDLMEIPRNPISCLTPIIY
jgi:hypothetical protein